MIKLQAFAYRNTRAVNRATSSPPERRRDNAYPYSSQECVRGPIHLLVEGNQNVDSLIYDSSEVSLICWVDLLGAGSNERAFPAAYLASLYKRNGDDFARGLRGTFAIILYDHLSLTLKGWTDHFGTEKLVYTESPEFFAVATDLRALHSHVPSSPGVDPAAIAEYLQYRCIPTPVSYTHLTLPTIYSV